jgi:hypothetical protein
VLLTLALYALTLQFSEWRRTKYSSFALALALGALFGTGFPIISPEAKILIAGVFAALLCFSSAPRRDPRRTTGRMFGVALTFLASLLLFANPAPISFVGFAVVVALLMRDEVRGWSVLRVGSGALIGAAMGLLGAETAAFIGLLPLGPVRGAALVALILLMAREGLGEAYQGGLRKELVFQGLAALFALSVLLFASISWSI